MVSQRILLINSEADVQEVMQDCLTHVGGWQVFSTGSPSEGLKYALFEQPDAIVFDCSTFGMDFITFLSKLRAQPETQNIPLVLIAAGMKWLNTRLFEQYRVVGVINDLSDPIELPNQIAKLLRWNKKPPSVEIVAPENSDSSFNYSA